MTISTIENAIEMLKYIDNTWQRWKDNCHDVSIHDGALLAIVGQDIQDIIASKTNLYEFKVLCDMQMIWFMHDKEFMNRLYNSAIAYIKQFHSDLFSRYLRTFECFMEMIGYEHA